MPRTIRVPMRVLLPAGRLLRPMQAYTALGITRMTAKRWRAHGMPGAERRGGSIDVQQLAAWLTARGCRVEWV